MGKKKRWRGRGGGGDGALYINFSRGSQQKKVATFFGNPKVVEPSSGEQAGICRRRGADSYA